LNAGAGCTPGIRSIDVERSQGNPLVVVGAPQQLEFSVAPQLLRDARPVARVEVHRAELRPFHDEHFFRGDQIDLPQVVNPRIAII
jgi:hypothetical protein